MSFDNVWATRLQSGIDTTQRLRLADTLPVAVDGLLEGYGGVRPNSGIVDVNQGTMQISVTEFVAWVPATTGTAEGGYVVVHDDKELQATADGDPNNDRIDLVVVRVHDASHDGGSTYAAEIDILTGTPGSGVPPDVPPNAIPLREVTVRKGLTAAGGGFKESDLGTDRRSFVASLGGVIVCQDASYRHGADAQPGQLVWRLDTESLEVYDDASKGWSVIWQHDPPHCRVTTTLDKNIANLTQVEVSWDNASINDGGMWSSGTDVTVPVAGTWAITAGLTFEGGSTGSLALGLAVNGTVVEWASITPGGATATAFNQVTVSAIRALSADDVITVVAFQNSGGTLQIITDNPGCFLEVGWVIN